MSILWFDEENGGQLRSMSSVLFNRESLLLLSSLVLRLVGSEIFEKGVMISLRPHVRGRSCVRCHLVTDKQRLRGLGGGCLALTR
jgi:hypothetical protein